MLIVCKSCASWKKWYKLKHERIADQTCTCGGKYTMLNCHKEGCKFLQFKECERSGYCEKRREKNGKNNHS